MDSIEDIADRLDRAADRYHNANDFQAESDARRAAKQARQSDSPQEAAQVEAAFFRLRAPGPSQVLQPDNDLGQNAGCLGRLFGGGGRSSSRARQAPYRGGVVYQRFMGGQYHSRTVADAISQNVPPGHPNAAQYAVGIAAVAGVATTALIGALTEAQIRSIADAIEADPKWRRANSGSSDSGPSSSSDNYSGGSYTDSDSAREDFAGGGGQASGGGASNDFGNAPESSGGSASAGFTGATDNS